MKYPYHSYRIMIQSYTDSRWSTPRAWGIQLRTRSNRCRKSSSELCQRHPWCWTASRMDRAMVHGTTLEDILPIWWREKGLPYVRWWLETTAPMHDLQYALGQMKAEAGSHD